MHNFVTKNSFWNGIKAATVCARAHVAANQSNQKEASLFARGTHTGGIVVSTNVCLCRITLPSLPGRMLMQLLPVFRGPSVSPNWFPVEPKNRPRWATISNWVRWPGVTVLGGLHWLTEAPLFFNTFVWFRSADSCITRLTRTRGDHDRWASRSHDKDTMTQGNGAERACGRQVSEGLLCNKGQVERLWTRGRHNWTPSMEEIRQPLESADSNSRGVRFREKLDGREQMEEDLHSAQVQRVVVGWKTLVPPFLHLSTVPKNCRTNQRKEGLKNLSERYQQPSKGHQRPPEILKALRGRPEAFSERQVLQWDCVGLQRDTRVRNTLHH